MNLILLEIPFYQSDIIREPFLFDLEWLPVSGLCGYNIFQPLNPRKNNQQATPSLNTTDITHLNITDITHLNTADNNLNELKQEVNQDDEEKQEVNQL